MKGKLVLERRKLALALLLLAMAGIGAGLLRTQFDWRTGAGPAAKGSTGSLETAKNKTGSKVVDPDAAMENGTGPEAYSPGGGQGGGEANELRALEDYWNQHVSFPTGKFDGAWLQQAAQQDKLVQAGVPAGTVTYSKVNNPSPLTLDPNRFISLGPRPEQTDACYSCYNYGPVSGRVNTIAIDPVNPSIAYIGVDGGGVWKTTNCCGPDTAWTTTFDDPLISTTAIDEVTIDPNNHNTVYAATGDFRAGFYSFGSNGILKSTDAGAHWTVIGQDVFTPTYELIPNSIRWQYQAVSAIKPDPRNSNTLVAGTKSGVFFSYNAGTDWTGPCLPDAYPDQRQDITELLLHVDGNSTTVWAAVGFSAYNSPNGTNGANGVYTTTIGTSGCPASWNLTTRGDNGWPAGTGDGTPGAGKPGRIDLAIAPSDPNYVYAQVQDPATNFQLGVWQSTDAGVSWEQRSDGSALDNSNCGFDYNQNWYDQGLDVDPHNPNTILMDTYDPWKSTDGGATFWDLGCGYTGGDTIHVDHHDIRYLPGSSSMAMAASDGGIYSTFEADVISPTLPVWNQLNNTMNTIEFYSGDITPNFANSPNPGANGGAQDNGSSVIVYSGTPGPAQWQLRNGGDGMFARIEPMLQQRWYQESQSGNLVVSLNGPYGPLQSARGPWTSDTRSFVFPYEIYKYDCPATGCTHMIAGSNRVWETIEGAVPATSWYTASENLTKGTYGSRSFISQLNYSVSLSTTAIVGTYDGNVQYGFGLGHGAPATWVDVTGGNTVLPLRPVQDVATDPTNPLVGYAVVAGFDQNTPDQPGHVFQVTCTANCASYTWVNKTGNLPNIPADSVIANPNYGNQVFVGTDWGLYYTNDITQSSPTWYRFNAGLPNVMVWDMQIDAANTTLSVWTRARGAYVWPLPSGPYLTPSPSPTCTINFSDVHPSDYFYEDVKCVYCLGAVSGYADGTFRPFNNTTRGQMSKIITLALRIPTSTPTGTPTFSDVPPDSPFYVYIETLAANNIVSGYADGTFRPNNNVTRGQLSKIVVISAVHTFGWDLIVPTTPTFTDVPPGSPFYEYIETVVCHGVVSGYDDHTFRPNNNAIRAQIAKIVCGTSKNPPSTCPVASPTVTPPAGSPTVTPTLPPGFCYTAATSTATIVPGTTDIGSHCDDCAITVQFPFPVTLYDQTFTQGYLSSNGSLILGVAVANPTTACLPNRNFYYSVMAYQSDLCTTDCGGYTCPTCGIFTATTGTAPHRQYIAEWRALDFNTGDQSNFEIILNEDSTTISVVYGANADNGAGRLAGVQQNPTTRYTQFSCGDALLTPGLKIDYVRAACAVRK